MRRVTVACQHFQRGRDLHQHTSVSPAMHQQLTGLRNSTTAKRWKRPKSLHLTRHGCRHRIESCQLAPPVFSAGILNEKHWPISSVNGPALWGWRAVFQRHGGHALHQTTGLHSTDRLVQKSRAACLVVAAVAIHAPQHPPPDCWTNRTTPAGFGPTSCPSSKPTRCLSPVEQGRLAEGDGGSVGAEKGRSGGPAGVTRRDPGSYPGRPGGRSRKPPDASFCLSTLGFTN
ncbi:hypothetical protein QBC47DRAFT_87345 [Echria macrotheca]|uniref:Uncharacterized protein n=1 Tax=Echria macrotheca TaxID=438768 RepID=A0AAJ0B416_9PEZI|nr:hypothetical protein QBC47DRAFT_87345 [Echria macrotheca]